MKLPSSMFISLEQTSHKHNQCLSAWILQTFYGDCTWQAWCYLSIPTSRRQSKKDYFSAFACERSQKGTKPKVQNQIQAYRQVSKSVCMKIHHQHDRQSELHLKHRGDNPTTVCLREIWLLPKEQAARELDSLNFTVPANHLGIWLLGGLWITRPSKSAYLIWPRVLLTLPFCAPHFEEQRPRSSSRGHCHLCSLQLHPALTWGPERNLPQRTELGVVCFRMEIPKATTFFF